MEDTITTFYCLCEEFLKATAHHDDPQVRLSTAEVMTVALTASAFFGSNMDRSRLFLHQHGYMPDMISKSRLNRRLHAIPLWRWDALFGILATAFKGATTAASMWSIASPSPCATTSASGAADSTEAKSLGATSPPRSAFSTVCGCT